MDDGTTNLTTFGYCGEINTRKLLCQARPRCRVRELPEYKHANWRGDLDPYYEAT